MQVFCPKCGQLLGGNDTNPVTDVARCPQCGEVFPLSTLIQANVLASADLTNPPRGAWYDKEFDGFTAGATTRHASAFFLVPFMVAWSGLSLAGIYGSQIVRGRFDWSESLFGIPFLLGSLVFGSVALMAVCGKVVVRVRDSEGTVFTGVGPFGWRRPFDATQVTGVSAEAYSLGTGSERMTIVIDGPHKLRFASGLSEARLDFLLKVLLHELTNAAVAREPEKMQP